MAILHLYYPKEKQCNKEEGEMKNKKDISPINTNLLYMPNNDLKLQKHTMDFCSVLGWHLITWNSSSTKGRNFKKM